MARVFSFSVPDEETELIQVLETWIKEKRLSFEIVRNLKLILRNYKNRDVINQEYLKLLEIEEKVNQALKILDEVQPDLNELKAKILKEKEAAEIEQNLGLLRLIETEFEDLKNPERLEQLKTFAKSQGTTLETFIEQRLSAIAAKCKASLDEAWQLFFKVFPKMKKELEV